MNYHFDAETIFKTEQVKDYQKVVGILEKANVSQKELTNFARTFEAFSKSNTLNIGQ